MWSKYWSVELKHGAPIELTWNIDLLWKDQNPWLNTTHMFMIEQKVIREQTLIVEVNYTDIPMEIILTNNQLILLSVRECMPNF